MKRVLREDKLLETVDQIRQRIGESPLSHVAEEDFFDWVTKTDADVISAIGVIEHLREPDAGLRLIQRTQIGRQDIQETAIRTLTE